MTRRFDAPAAHRSSADLARRVRGLLADVRGVDAGAAGNARACHDTLVKPPGSLGRIEALGAQLAAVAGRCPPPVPKRPAVLVAAADHGVHARGVTPWPQAITTTIVETCCSGGAAANALAAVTDAQVAVLDVGCVDEPADHPLLRKARVRAGTADLSTGPAMSREEATRALLAGEGIVRTLVARGVDLLVTGDVGMANTTASACLIGAFTGADPSAVTGRGTGVDHATLEHKKGVVKAALELHRPDPTDPLGALAAVGGLEQAALAGAMLTAAAEGIPVVLDGVVTNAAALAAVALAPALREYLIAGHRSAEPGAGVALAQLGLAPLLELDMRLGEGTGGLLAVPLVVAAAEALTRMGRLDDVLPG